MFSKLKNCSKCGRVFQAEEIGQKHCLRCRGNEDDLFLKAREFIYDNPQTNVIEVSEELDIEEDLILKWLRKVDWSLKVKVLDTLVIDVENLLNQVDFVTHVKRN